MSKFIIMKRANVQTCKRANVQTCKRANLTELINAGMELLGPLT